MVELGLADLGTVVTYNPWAVAIDTSLPEVVRRYTETEFQHWPVADAEGQLLGIVSEVDIVRALEEVATAISHRGDLPTECHSALERCCVGDFMTRRPVTIDGRSSLATALRLLNEHAVRALPVLEDQQLVGLITSSDILREFSYGEWPTARDCVVDLLEQVPESIDSDASLDEAAIALHLASAEHLGVVRADFPLGVITKQDLRMARCLATANKYLSQAGCFAGPTTVRELATSAPTVRPGTALAEAAAALVASGRRAATVMNQAGRLLGVINESGVLTRVTRLLFPE